MLEKNVTDNPFCTNEAALLQKFCLWQGSIEMQRCSAYIRFSIDLKCNLYVNCAIFFRILEREIGIVRPTRKAVLPGEYFVQIVSDL